MIKAIFKDEIKNIPYGKVSYGVSSIIPCNATNVLLDKNTMITLAAFTNNGLKVIKSRIGKIISMDYNNIKIQFNTEFGFDDKLYALVTDNSVIKNPKALILAYKEI